MIILHQYPKAFNLPSLSPFCIKVEFFLKLAKLPYEVKVEVNPAKGPKGKMPFIEDQGKSIPDSSFILKHLIQEYHLEHLEISDSGLRAKAHAFKMMIEESLYFILLYSRWVDEDGFRIIEKAFVPMFPPLIGGPFLRVIRKNLKRQAFAQGLGRHSKEEVYQIGKDQIEALAILLGENDFFFEDKISVFDATAYSFLSTILKQPIDSPLKSALLEKSRLCSYVKRLDERMEFTC